jgi:Leucine rich repeat
MNTIKGSSISSRQHSLSKSKKGNKAERCKESQTRHHPSLITTKELSAIKEGLNDSNCLRLSTASPTLPPSFFILFKILRVLDLRKTGLQILPPQIIELKNLHSLDLRYNNLTYLPSQIAQLPNLHQLQIEDVRNRKNKVLKEIDILTDTMTMPSEQVKCSCIIRPDGQRIPPLPTLGQLSTRTILSTMRSTASTDPESLSWEDLEPFYSTGKFEDNPNHIIPFPSHLLPSHIPIDICSSCYEPVFPAHAQLEKIQVVALCRVRLRYVFCSHKCFSKIVEQWENERMFEEAKKLARQNRFHTKDHGYVNEL